MREMINTIASIVIGILISGYLFALKSGWTLPFSSNPKIAFIAFVVVGMAFCGVGIGHSVENVGWSNPLVIVGIGFGIVNLYIAYTALTGGQVLFVHDYTSATMTLGGVMLLKVITKVAMNFLYI